MTQQQLSYDGKTTDYNGVLYTKHSLCRVFAWQTLRWWINTGKDQFNTHKARIVIQIDNTNRYGW